MQDIDFDEIDRAVNSLTSPSSDAPTKPVSDDPTPAVTEPVAETSSEPVVPAPTAPSPAARRSSGRFMDVVHPSSDMRPSVSDRPAPSAPIFHREEVAERAEPEERPESAPVSGTAFHWPDPIDIAASEPTPEPMPEPSVSDPTPEVAEEPSTAPEPGDLIDDEDEPDNEATPLESPFLPDAKVEKRPLGAFSGADEGLPLLEDPIPFSMAPAPQSDEPEVEVEEPAHEEHETHPEELHPELLALDGHNQDEPLLEATNPPDATPAPLVDDAPSGPTSITQQYTEQTSSTAEASGAIFDTDAYHLPLTHTAKKNSGVMIVVWIIALILVGGGIGAGIYFVLLPMLG
jgi:hypothetical protein